jgi:hypothetical protein
MTERRWPRLMILGLLCLTALTIRLYRIDDPPLNFHETRQYRSLIIARVYYFDRSTSVPEWQRTVARASRQKQGILEPPILEFLVSIGYQALGGERGWLAGVLSSVFWLIGGGFLYRIGERIAGADSALFSVGFYLLLPFAVVASRSFQPDPLMVMLMLASVLAIVRYHDAPSRSRLGIAALTSSAAFMVKPGSAFMIVGAFVALEILRHGVWSALTSRTTLVFIATMLVPTVLTYALAVASGRFLMGEATKTLLPQLWVSPFFWRSWLDNIGLTVGLIPFVMALLGTLLLDDGVPRALVTGLWIGYVTFGLALNYNFATHDYYQLPLIPIVGLCAGPVVALVINHGVQRHRQVRWRVAVCIVLLLAVVLSLRIAKSRLSNPDVWHRVRTEQEIGDRVNHSTKTVFLSSDYGVPLEYHGLLSGAAWPLAADLEWERLAGVPTLTAEERFQARFSRESPEYFIVEDFRELERQPDLKQFLSNFPLLFRSDRYLVFGLQAR